MKKVALEGVSVAVTGKVKGYTKKTLRERVEHFGGYFTTSDPSAGHGLVLLGDNASQHKLHQAMAHGLPIVQGDALRMLLEDGEVELGENTEKKEFDEILGAVRGLLGGKFTQQTWTELIELVDSCQEEDMPRLLAYLEPQLEVRSAQYHANRLAYDFGQGSYRPAAGERQPFPATWLAQGMNGVMHDRFRLCKTLSFTPLFVGSTLAAKVFDQDAFAHITTFDTGDVMESYMKKKSFYKKMAKAKNLQNVETLVLGMDRDGAFAELLGATSLPGVKSLYLRMNTMIMKQMNQGSDIVFGPWAAQLETLGLVSPEQLVAVHQRVDELPALEHLVLSVSRASTPEQLAPYCEALGPMLEHVKRLSLHLHSGYGDEFLHQDGLGALLDVVSRFELDVLDLRACERSVLEDEVGKLFVKAHFIDNGLSSSLGVLMVGEQVAPDICEILREAGLEVQAPVQTALKAQAPEFHFIQDVPDGEEERQAAHTVHVHDAMMFEKPSKAGWEVLVGVVNGLEMQLDDTAFAEAMETLVEYLSQWPDDLRVLPEQWYKALFDEVYSPKLALARTLKLRYRSYCSDFKSMSRWITRLARAPQISSLDVLHVSMEGQKHALKAVFELVQVMKPEAIVLGMADKHREAFYKLFEDGSLPTIREPIYRQDPEKIRSIDAYKQRHVVHTVTSLAELQEVLSLKNLDHVVSLEIEFDYDGFHDVSDYSVLDPHPASFESLRYLELGISSSNEQLHRALADWLQEASPVAVHHDFGSKDAATLMLELARAGVYGRAYGATVVFPSRVDREALEACLGNEAFNVAHLRFVPYEGYDLPGVPEVVALMHERLREGLRELYWATELSEWSDVGAACARLPRLSTFAPVDGNFLNAHTRADYLEGFESLEELHRLAFVKWLVPQMQAPTVFGAKELKALQKIEGKPCDALYLSRYMDPNH